MPGGVLADIPAESHSTGGAAGRCTRKEGATGREGGICARAAVGRGRLACVVGSRSGRGGGAGRGGGLAANTSMLERFRSGEWCGGGLDSVTDNLLVHQLVDALGDHPDEVECLRL